MKLHSVSILLVLGAMACSLAAADPALKRRQVDEQPPEATQDPIDQTGARKQPKDAEARFRWNTRTLVAEYEAIGRRSPKWDGPANKALGMLARGRSYGPNFDTNFWQVVHDSCQEAVSAGCDDPLIRYVHTRYVIGPASRASKETAPQYIDAARQMRESKYSDIRKFYACLRAAEAAKAAAGKNNPHTPREVHEFRKAAADYLTSVVQDGTIPGGEIYDACFQLLDASRLNPREHEAFFNVLEPHLVKNWPQEASLYLLRGNYYIDYAWHARGNAVASRVTAEGWKGFAERLVVAQKCLEKAWKLDPTDARIPVAMIILELGQGEGRDRMEMWFQRAMELDPNNYHACWQKLYYLAPKWYGSPKDMLDFGRECAASEQWGGRVPLMLLEAHVHLAYYTGREAGNAARKDYWKQPAIWQDVKTSFDKFFQLHPAAVGYRCQYVRYAYLCEQWEELNKQLSLLGPVNYDDFGGKQKFDEMVKLAKEHVGKGGKVAD